MKSRKAVGPDGVPVEVWKKSALTKQESYAYFSWRIFGRKNVSCTKDSRHCCAHLLYCTRRNDWSMTTSSQIQNTGFAQSYIQDHVNLPIEQNTGRDWLVYFGVTSRIPRSELGCRDNIRGVWIHVYDQIIRRNDKCVINTLILSQHLTVCPINFQMRRSNRRRQAERQDLCSKSYSATQGAARIQAKAGKFTFSTTFEISWGVVQGNIIRAIFFIISPEVWQKRYGH